MNQHPNRVRIALSYLNPASREVWVRAATCIKSEFPDSEGLKSGTSGAPSATATARRRPGPCGSP